MYYVFETKKMRILVTILLFVVVSLFICRYILIPKFLFPQKYIEYVEKYSEKYDLEPSLVYAVINTESKFDPNAISYKGACGLMQVSVITGEWGATEVGMKNYSSELLFDPEINIELGCWYLETLLLQFGGNMNTALAAYNAGSGNVSKWLKNDLYSDDGYNLADIPFKETVHYVKKVIFSKKMYEKLY